MQPNANSLASYLDQTLLKAEATAEQIDKICAEAIEHSFFGVCVNSSWIPRVSQKLAGHPSVPVAVVGFPLGAMSSEAKAFEAKYSVSRGAKEIDMVLAIGLLKAKNYDAVQADIAQVVEASKPAGVKVILETSLLTQEEKVKACELAKAAGAAFVKTSTGFGGGGASIEDIQLMRSVVGPNLGVKASGGVKTREQAEALIQAGATRIGTSSGVALVLGQTSSGGY